jgi:hypothetical protein
MTITNTSHKKPRGIVFHKKPETIQWIVSGQGVFLFDHADITSPCTFRIHDISGHEYLNVILTQTSVEVYQNGSLLKDPNNTRGLDPMAGASYWCSLDYQNRRLQVGVGEARMETSIYKYEFEQTPENKRWLRNLVGIAITNGTTPLRLLRDPITRSVPLLVQNTQHLTMDAVAKNESMPSANLSTTAQKLYNCIRGKQFTLNTPDFPAFTKAIEYSIRTPGCWCYETLKAKSTEFGPEPNIQETYLRITLNENNGESPGIPYVMEIWPVGHYSPIHNHGGAHAVIRVLHGGIHVSMFSFLGGNMFGSADFKKGDVTWISPTLNQVHQLKNLEGNKDTCITIQCYMYDSKDVQHHDTFDYLDADGTEQHFDPNSDMEFVKFKETIRAEWVAKSAHRSMLCRLWQKVKRVFS